jgi:hypothetical protein
VTWLVVAVPVSVLVFLNSSRTTVVATHEAVISPDLDGWVEIDLGPVLPSFRYPTDARLGADIALGKTSAVSYDELVQRYVLLSSNPNGQVAKVRDALLEMALAAALTGTLAGLAVPSVWLLLGGRRRAEVAGSPRWRPAPGTMPRAGSRSRPGSRWPLRSPTCRSRPRPGGSRSTRPC